MTSQLLPLISQVPRPTAVKSCSTVDAILDDTVRSPNANYDIEREPLLPKSSLAAKSEAEEQSVVAGPQHPSPLCAHSG